MVGGAIGKSLYVRFSCISTHKHSWCTDLACQVWEASGEEGAHRPG